MRVFRGFLIGILLLLSAAAALADEKIQSFDVLIQVDPNGDFTITETIRVDVEGDQISRGIYRDIPRFLDHDGRKIPQKIDVQSVTRNGKKEPFDVNNRFNVRRIKIGDKDIYLPHTTHTYEIRYRMNNQIRRFDEADEVYWNVTGNYWKFPIESASAIIQMPGSPTVLERNVYTGSQGSTGQGAQFGQTGSHVAVRTTKPLGKSEGMTVSVRYAKGAIQAPSEVQKFGLWWLINGASVIAALSFLGLLGYYLTSWSKVGRDPAKDPVYPRYHPPADYSPGAVAHIYKRGMPGNEALMAALISLGIKKHMHIDAGKRQTILVRQRSGNSALLSGDESVLMDRLFGKYESDTLTLKRKYNATFTKAVEKHGKHLSKKFGSQYFKYNGAYIASGIIMSALAVFVAFKQLTGDPSPIFIGAVMIIVLLNLLFIVLLPAPTIKGQKIRGEIEGLKLFIKTAEKQKMDAVNIYGEDLPPMSVERYEELLPYAIALGVEKPWSKHFEKTLPVDAERYDPTWSSGSYRDFGSMSKMTDHMVSNLASSAQHAQPQSSSSSGGGGGGFSGGGGGGGGGGGW